MSTLIRRGVKRVIRFVLKKVVLKAIARPIRRNLAQFEAATHNPREVQEALLRGILARQAATAFGRDHRFDAIRTVEDFRRQLPVAGYEYFEPYIARVRRGETSALLADPRVHMFALTSGTTAVRKFIPVTQQYLDDYRRGWNIWGLKVFRDHPQVRMQPILQMSGDWDEFRTESGVPCGAVTGLTAHMQKRVIRWLYSVPPCIARIKDPRSKYYAVLLLSIPRKVGMIIAANPSTFINLALTGDQEKEALIRDLHDGTLSRHLDLPEDIRADLTRRLRKHPERASAARRDRRANGHAVSEGLLAVRLHSRQLDRRQRRFLLAALSALLRRHAGARHRPDRQRRTHDHPADGRHARRRPRCHDALLRVHPRSGGR